VLGAETLLSAADPGDGGLPFPAANDQMWSRASFGTSSFLVVWWDSRIPYGVYGARVDMSGALIGPNIVIRDGQGWGTLDPTVAFNASTAEWLVAWSRANDIEAQRVTEATGALSGGLINVSSAQDIQTHPTVACMGPDCVVTWEDHRNGAAGA